MTNELTPREQIHDDYCPDERCILAYRDPGRSCRDLDRLLDQVAYGPLMEAFKQVLDSHMGALLLHGPGVASGIAVAVKILNGTLPEELRGRVIVEWAENTPGETR